MDNNRVFNKLMQFRVNTDPLTEQDQIHIRMSIDRYLKAGWTDNEIVQHLRWIEEMDNVTPEEVCLRKISESYDRVTTRLIAEELKNAVH